MIDRCRFRELALASSVPPATDGLSNNVGTASGLSYFFLFSSPIAEAKAESGSKHGSTKCALHTTLCSLGSFQSALVRWTYLTHRCLKEASFGNLWRLTPSRCVGAACSYAPLSHVAFDKSVHRTAHLYAYYLVPPLTSRTLRPA